MQLIKHKHYTLITIYNTNDFNKLINKLNNSVSQKTSVIINCLKCNIADDIIVDKLLPFHFIWQKTNNSFILVSNIRKKLLNDMVSINTLEEALDFFHMEQLTRNL